MYYPSIESATALIMMKTSQEFYHFCRSAKMDFVHSAGPGSVCLDMQFHLHIQNSSHYI